MTNDVCVCNSGFTGGDCSLRTYDTWPWFAALQLAPAGPGLPKPYARVCRARDEGKGASAGHNYTVYLYAVYVDAVVACPL